MRLIWVPVVVVVVLCCVLGGLALAEPSAQVSLEDDIGPQSNEVSWSVAREGLPDTGSYYGIALGDANRDGTLDAFVGLANGGIKLFENSGVPVWTDKTSANLPTTGNWYGLAVADLDEDGLPDLVAGGENGLLVCMQQGRVLRWAVTTLTSSYGYAEVAVGDVNGDGRPEIAAASTSSAAVHIWAYDPGKGWYLWRALEVPGPLWGVALGDFTNDGYLDVAAGSSYAPSGVPTGGVYAWINSGAPNFSFSYAYKGLPYRTDLWRDVAFGDFNLDGKLDLAATSSVGIGAWLGDGAGNWTAYATGLPTKGSYAGLGVGDLDNDGKLDLIATRLDQNGIEPYRNAGGSWTRLKVPTSVDSWHNLALGDLNSDGILDLAATNPNRGGVCAWVGAGTPAAMGNWVAVASPIVTGTYWGVDVGDINLDGWLDVVGASQLGASAEQGVRIWAGDGGNTWSLLNYPAVGAPVYQPPINVRYEDAVVGDFSRDGIPDVVAGSYGVGVSTWRGNTYWPASTGISNTGEYRAVALGDIDRDGELDVVGVETGDGAYAWRSLGGSSGWSFLSQIVAGNGWRSVALGDINRDGYLDVILGGNGVQVYRGNGGSSWVAMTSPDSVVDDNYYSLAVGDINHDGYPDIVGSRVGGYGLYVWAGNGGTAWTPMTSPDTTGLYWGIAMADINNDGQLDIAAGNYNNGGVKVWLGNGGTGWTLSTAGLPTTGSFTQVSFGHIDHDGVLDLIAASYDDHGVKVWTQAESTPPGSWSLVAPSGWAQSLTLDVVASVRDSVSGLNVDSGEYSYSSDGGSSWSSWTGATVSGSNGTTDPQHVTAHVTFAGDSLGTARNRIKFRIRDMVGNLGTSGEMLVPIDTTAPSNPTAFTSTPVFNVWTNDASPVMNWSGASDTSSGVYGYSYQWSTNPTEVPDNVLDITSGPVVTSIPSDGANWYFHVRTRDIAGNWNSGAAHSSLPYKLDTVAPSTPAFTGSNPPVSSWTSDNTVYVTWSAATDAASGIAGYSYAFNTSASFTPDTVVDTTSLNVTSSPLADGDFYAHVRAIDNAGNGGSTVHRGPFHIDRTAPSSAVTSPYGDVSSNSFTVHWAGTDAGSGIDTYDVQYKDVTTNSGWNSWQSGVSDVSHTFYATAGHKYQFRCRARDNVGNVEAWPATYDVQVTVATLDFGVDHTGSVEVTQAVQDRNNSVQLIENKPTFVRFHVHADTGSGAISARLSIWRGGVLQGHVLPSNPGGTANITADPDRGQLNQSLWFQLPSSYLHGTIQIVAEANYDHRLAESDYGDNYGTATVSFNYSPPMNILMVDACYQAGGVTYHVRNQDRWALEDWLRKGYPINALNVWWGVFVTCYDHPPSAGEINADLVWNQGQHVISADEDPYTRYYGMVSDGYWRTTTSCWMRGCANGIPDTVASGPAGRSDRCATWDPDGDSYADWYGAHEIGHTYNRYHAEFCGAGGGVPYPYPNGDISPSQDEDAANALYGFDIQTHMIYPPSWKDLMTYCDNEWPSDYTYEGILSRMVAEKPAAYSYMRPQATGEYLAVFGSIITATDQVTLKTFYRVQDAWDWLGRVPGAYSIRLLDSSGLQLADYPFTPRTAGTETMMTNESVLDTVAVSVIAEYVPWVPGTARVAIYHGSTELMGRQVSANAPQVTVISPNGGENLTGADTTITWTASDADGNSLVFTVQYSTDGGAHWVPIGSNITQNSLTISTALLPGTTQGRVRVLASDGVNTGYDDSNGNFTVPMKGPDLRVVAPTGTSYYLFGQTVAMQAEASDVEDGPMGDAAFSWTSSLSGALGTGRNLAVQDLITGTHSITVTVTDSNGLTSSASAVVVVSGELTNTVWLPTTFRNWMGPFGQ